MALNMLLEWYCRLDEHLLSLGFVRNINEVTLYVKNVTHIH